MTYRRTMEAMAFACMAGIVFLTAAQVFSRYVLQASLFWPEEAARILLIMITFLIAGLSYEKGEMIGVTMLRDMMGRRVSLLISILGHLLILILLVFLVRYGWAFAEMNSIQRAAALRISMFWVYLAIPIGMAILAVHIALSLLYRIIELRRGEEMQS